MDFVLSSFLILLICSLKRSTCFNLDLSFVELIDIGSASKYFGYSVLLQKGDVSSVLVGAPKANSTYVNHRNIKEPGVLYKCDIGDKNCNQYVIDREGNTEFRGGDSRFNYKNKKDGSFLGATIDGGENIGDPVFVCSPKWINDRLDRNGQHYLVNGMCYQLRNSRNLQDPAVKLMPLLNAGKQGYTFEYVVKYYYAMGEVGTSMLFLNDTKELLLGAPGLLSWKGSVVRYKATSSGGLQPQRLTRFRTKRQVNTAVNIPNPVYISSLKEENTYFGYAISAGRFTRKYRDLWYVAGAPRAEELYGLVMLYEFVGYDDSDLSVHKKLVGEQMGAYFGASVLCVDVTLNLVSDLLIGAPSYFIDSWDEGCVYFYKNDGQGNFDKPIKIFGSKQVGARFGTSLSNIGDINHDSYPDIAISAPYEDNQGAVYIYLGGKNGLTNEYSQKILAKTINGVLNGFGFSISKGVDIDKNLYNDIAVGAYKSGQVVIIKSRPVIKYFGRIKSGVKELSVDTKKFTVTYCLNFTSSTGNVNAVDTLIQIAMDPRTSNNNNIFELAKLTKDVNHCKNIEIVLRASEGDYINPFRIEITYKIIEGKPKEFCGTCPVTDPSESNSVALNIPFANGCGSDNICQPDLSISANFQDNLESIVIGAITTLDLNVHIDNVGEPAYLCHFHMTLPENIEILRISSKCEIEDKNFDCLVADVLKPDTHKTLMFELDVKKLSPNTEKISLNLTVDSKGEEVNVEDNSLLLNLSLKLENNVQITGNSFPDQIVYVDEDNNVKTEDVTYSNEYFIKNYGPSPLPNSEIRFYLPVESLNPTIKNQVIFDIYKPEVFTSTQPLQCTTDYNLGFFTDNVAGSESGIEEENSREVKDRVRRDVQSASSPDLMDLPLNRTVFINCTNADVRCMKIVCTTDEIINKNQLITAKFQIKAHIKVLQKILGSKDIVVVSSTAESVVGEKVVRNHISTLLVGSLKSEKVSNWVYIVCILAALLILGIIILVLYKLKFFQRPDRDKLLNESEGPAVERILVENDSDSTVEENT